MNILQKIIGVVAIAVFSAASPVPEKFDEFQQGYYIDRKKEKIEGWVRYVKGIRPKLEYKENLDDKKIKKLNAFSCSGFGMGADTRFVVCPKATIVKIAGLNRTVAYDWLRVIEEGNITLYKYYTETESKDKRDFTPIDVEVGLVRNGESWLVPLSGNDDKTQQMLEVLFPGQPKTVKALMSDNWDDVVKFVQDYNKK